MIVAKQETIVYFSIEDIEFYELETLAIATRMAMTNPTLVLDQVRFNALKEINAKLEAKVNDTRRG